VVVVEPESIRWQETAELVAVAVEHIQLALLEEVLEVAASPLVLQAPHRVAPELPIQVAAAAAANGTHQEVQEVLEL
jgi:hypothetical protein